MCAGCHAGHGAEPVHGAAAGRAEAIEQRRLGAGRKEGGEDEADRWAGLVSGREGKEGAGERRRRVGLGAGAGRWLGLAGKGWVGPSAGKGEGEGLGRFGAGLGFLFSGFSTPFLFLF